MKFENEVMKKTKIFNEERLLKLVVNWFSRNNHNTSPVNLRFNESTRWYTEALLQPPFLDVEGIREGYTNADCVIGDFNIGEGNNKGKLILVNDCKKFIVIESKLGSELSKGVSNNKEYNQAARNVVCLIHNLIKSKISVTEVENIGFYVLAPKAKKDRFNKFLMKEDIKASIENRIKDYKNYMETI
ncbi:hypothetical protein RI065_10065 [Mycoplasmatota bacterium zrk1]